MFYQLYDCNRRDRRKSVFNEIDKSNKIMKCLSCKNKTSNERCKNDALNGLEMCGVHIKTKNPRSWIVVNNIHKKVTLISKIWKGYFVRKQLELAGPGVIKRKECSNEEELTTFDSIASVYPLDYFGFVENSKIYGFNIKTIIQILNENAQNPYTRQPLTIDTRKRLRQIYSYRIRNKIPVYFENSPRVPPNLIHHKRWLHVCQIIEENGFFDTQPNFFTGLSKIQLYTLVNLIFNDVRLWSMEHKNTRRSVYVFWLRNTIRKYQIQPSTEEYSSTVAGILALILYDCANPYPMCFIIMSALFRL